MSDSDPRRLKCGFCKETAHHIFCDCDVLVNFRVKHLENHFCVPDDFEDISYVEINAYMAENGLMKEN